MVQAGLTNPDKARFSPGPARSRWRLHVVGVLLIVAGLSVFVLPLFASLVVEAAVGGPS